MTFAPAEGQKRRGFCNNRGVYEEIDRHYTWQKRIGLFNFTVGLAQVQQEIQIIKRAKLGTERGLEEWKKTPALQNTIGSTPLEWRNRYKKLKKKPIEAELACGIEGGNILNLENGEDEDALGALAQRYGIKTLFLTKRPAYNGVFSLLGYYFGPYNSSKLETLYYESNKDYGPLIFTVDANGDESIGMPVAPDQQIELDFLCTYPLPQSVRTKPEEAGLNALTLEIQNELLLYQESMESVVSQIEGVGAVELPEAPSNEPIMEITSIPTGVKTVRIALDRMSQIAFWTDSRINLLVELETYRSLLERTRKSLHSTSKLESRPYINVNVDKNSLNQQLGRSKRAAPGLIFWARIFLSELFSQTVGKGIIQWAAKSSPTILYFVRSFFNAGRLLADKYLVSQDVANSYSLTNRPALARCEEFKIGNAIEKVCDGVLSGKQHRNYGCGLSLLTGRGDGTGSPCDEIKPEEDTYVYSSANCGKNKLRPYKRQDLVISNRNGTVNINCKNGKTTTISYTRQPTAISPQHFTSGDCSVINDDGRLLFTRSGSGETQLDLGDVLSQGPYKPPEVFIPTPFGKITKQDLYLLLVALIVLLFVTMTLALICCFPCGREWALDNLCCCCFKGGFTLWKSRHFACIPACVSDDESNRGGDREMQEMRAPPPPGRRSQAPPPPQEKQRDPAEQEPLVPRGPVPSYVATCQDSDSRVATGARRKTSDRREAKSAV